MDPGTIATIISAPGQLVKAAVALKKLYDAFFDEHRNSSTEAREFAQLVATFAINLINQERLISRVGKFFPGEENFLKTIDQCERYLQGYDNLLRERAKPIRKAYETAKWSQDLAQDRKMLMDKLNIHVNSMNAFSMTVLLEIALHDREAIRTTSSAAADISVPDEDQTLQKFQHSYNRVYDQIVLLQNRQKRDPRYKRTPGLVMTDLEKIIEQWRNVMIESGVGPEALPSIPGSEKDAPDRIMQLWRKERFFERGTGEQSLRSRSSSSGSDSQSGGMTPTSSRSPIHADRTPTSRRDSAISTTSSRRPSTLSDLDNSSSRRASVQSPPPSFPKPSPHPETDLQHSPIDDVLFGSPNYRPERSPSIASSFQPSVFDASPTPTWGSAFTGTSLMSQRKGSKDLLTDGLHRLSITSTSTGSREAVAQIRWNERKVSLYTYEVDDTRKSRTLIWNPDTEHKLEHIIGKSAQPFTKHSSFKRPLDVCFLSDHEIRYHKKTFKATPTYIFNDAAESSAFQSLISGRQLLCTFDVEKIATATSSKPGEATVQHLKIWKSKTAKDRYYLTYFANAIDPQKTRQFLVSWFDRPTLPSDTSKSKSSSTIKLTLAKSSQRPRTISGSSRRRSGLSISSFSSITRRETLTSPPPSITDTSTRQNSFATIADSDDPCCPDDLAKLEFLQIELESAQARADFVDAFCRAHDRTLGMVPVAQQSPQIPEMEFGESGGKDASRRASLLNLDGDGEGMDGGKFASQRATPASLLGMGTAHLVR